MKRYYILTLLFLFYHYSIAFRSACAGESHVCVILDNGIVKCWGDNRYGQLGYGDYKSRGLDHTDVPPSSISIPEPVYRIVCGINFTCALSMTGKVYCWGSNTRGQLGLGTNEQSINKPTINVQLSTTVVIVCVGGSYVCVLLQTGNVQCWGANEYGQLCTRDSRDRGLLPTDFPLNSTTNGALSISCGLNHIFAMINTNRLIGWGDNRYGQLAYGKNQAPYDIVGIYPVSVPVIASVFVSVQSVSLGAMHSCFLAWNSSVYCYGNNSLGQLGYPNVTEIGSNITTMPSPAITLPFAVTNVVCYHSYTCVSGYWPIPRKGMLPNVTTCWGDNGYGQLGFGNTIAGIGVYPNTMPPPFLNVSTSIVLSYIGSSSTRTSTYLVLMYSGMKGGNTTVPPHLVTKTVLSGWGMNNVGQLLTGFQTTNPQLDPLLLNIECGDRDIDVENGEECDLGTNTNGQECTPFCGLAQCLVDSNCTMCSARNLSIDSSGCFLTTKQCADSQPVNNSVCSNGNWSTQSLINSNVLVLVGSLEVTGDYTQLSNGTLILRNNTLLVVTGNATIDGTVILPNETGNGTVIVVANNIDGSFTDIRNGGVCNRQVVTRDDETQLQTLAVISSHCKSGINKWIYIGVTIGFVALAVILGATMYLLYRKRLIRCLFREIKKKEYEYIG